MGAVLPVRQLNPATEQLVGIYSVNISHSLQHCLADYCQAELLFYRVAAENPCLKGGMFPGLVRRQPHRQRAK